jgi:hypothetical protein
VFVGWVIQTLGLQLCFVGSRGHGAFLKNSAGIKDTALQQTRQAQQLGSDSNFLIVRLDFY